MKNLSHHKDVETDLVVEPHDHLPGKTPKDLKVIFPKDKNDAFSIAHL